MYGKHQLNAGVCNIIVILSVLYFSFFILINNALHTILQQQFATGCYTLLYLTQSIVKECLESHYEVLKRLTTYQTEDANDWQIPIHYLSARSINDFAVE